jgi:hypothetical protein
MLIMGWNIERFGVNKFLDNHWDTTASRQAHITRMVELVHPDVLVIIEVQTAANEGFGGLISDTSGGPATRALLEHLRAIYPAEEWCAVPPVILSPPAAKYREGIAVLFKASVLAFQGPWTNTAAGIIPLTEGAPPIPYDGLWAGALRAAESGLGFNQDCLAGQYAFFNGNQRLEYGGATARSVWRTRFIQNTGRHLDLYSLHFPPQPLSAREALGELALTPEIGTAVGPEEDRVIIGDFNINVNNPGEIQAFQHLTGGPAYMPAFPVCPVEYQLQFGAGSVTNVVPVLDATTNGAGPYYGYASSNAAGQWLGLDNALVTRPAGAAAPANQLIVNSIEGPPAAFDMASTIPNMIATIPPGGGRKARLNTLVNFGHIGARRGASDHMPIVLELP